MEEVICLVHLDHLFMRPPSVGMIPACGLSIEGLERIQCQVGTDPEQVESDRMQSPGFSNDVMRRSDDFPGCRRSLDDRIEG